MQITYYGPLTPDVFYYLRGAVKEVAKDAAALVIRMDYALSLIDTTPTLLPTRVRSPPAACIVRREDYAMWVEFGRKIAATGVKRAVFCQSQAALAYLWAEDHAGLVPEQSLLSR